MSIRHARHIFEIQFLFMHIQYNKTLRKLLFCHLIELDIIRTKHADIHIVVPRNIPSMPDCAKQRATVCKPTDIVFLADFVNLFEHLELRCPCTLHGSRNIESFPDFIFKICMWKLHIIPPETKQAGPYRASRILSIIFQLLK